MTSTARYDIRAGASSYAPIVGTIGAFVVPAIVLVFTQHLDASPNLVFFAVGLLIVGLAGSLLGALGFAAIGAETETTANLPPAILYISVPASIAVISVIGAFQVLSAMFLPTAETLLAAVTAGTGMVTTIYIGFGISDSRHPALGGRHPWLTSMAHAYRAAIQFSVAGIIPIAAALIAYGIHATIRPTSSWIDALIVAGLVSAISSFVMGSIRTAHPVPDPAGNVEQEVGLRRSEAIISCGLTSLYTAVIVVLLPN